MGEWKKRSPFLSRTTVIRVENGSGSLTAKMESIPVLHKTISVELRLF
jgi:hypothetical protein